MRAAVERPTDVFVAPEKYADTPVGDLLDAAALGHSGRDQRWLTAIVSRPGDAIPELVRRGLASRADDRINLTEDLVRILHHLATPQALPFYIKVLREELLEPPEYLVEAIVALGPASIEPLLALYQELDETGRTEIAFLLAELRVHDPRVLAVLLDRLNQRRWDGAFCLSVYGDPAARLAIEKLLAEQPGDPELRRTLEDLDRPAAAVSAAPFDLFALYPERATPDLEVLPVDERLEMLASEVDEYRSASALSFFHEELSTPAVEALFAAARDDTSAEVRARAWEALAGEERADIRAALRERVNDPARPLAERCGALVAVAQVDEPAVHARILEFYEIPEARAKALEAMWRSLDPVFGRYFPPHLDDQDREVRRQAIRGAGFCELHATVGRLRELWDDEDLRTDALFAYALAMPGVTSPAHLRALLSRIDKEAGGLDEDDEEIVKMALDERLRLHGLDPFFFPDTGDEEPDEKAPAVKAGRNDPCPCGSGKKFKKCCGA